MTLLLSGLLLPWFVVGFLGWLGYQLVLQNGRILGRLEALERRLGPAPSQSAGATPGLPVGSLAPEFALPDLNGVRTTLSQFRGRRLLLIFFSPRCGYCVRMADDLAALPLGEVPGAPLPLVVTTGDLEANRT